MKIQKNDILVSIHCLVYNHGKYLRECLEGFVMQKTNFKFEAIVHDDASSDNSTEIISEYASKYPDIIKPIFEKENIYSKHGFAGVFKLMIPFLNGHFIAFCEGDDYWTDSLKLQKQVEYMLMHPECSMTFHRADTITEGVNNSFVRSEFQKLENREYKGEEIFEKWLVPTASVMCTKNVYISEVFLQAISNPRFVFADIILALSCAHFGKIIALEDNMCIYRRHAEGASFIISEKKTNSLANHYLEIYKTFGNSYKRIAINKSCKVFTEGFVLSILGSIKNKKYLLRWIPIYAILRYPIFMCFNLAGSLYVHMVKNPILKRV